MCVWGGGSSPVIPICLGSHLGETGSLDEVVEFAQRGIAWQRLDVLEQVLLFRLEQLPVIWD